ncbi:MAG: MCE family protein [Eudoraea sp.]|nr:MCE family protein [Eudoraea sp.]
MERTTVEKIRLGVFVVTGTVLLVLAAYLIGNRQNMFGKTFDVNAVFKNVNGLQKGNNVRFSGIDIGTVNRIDMENDSTIIVGMIIEDKMRSHIKKDAIATIGSDGLVGSMIVNIVPGPGTAAFIEPGDIIASYSRIGAEDMLSTLNVTNQNAALLTADLLKVTTALTNGEGTLGKLLNDTVMAGNLDVTIKNLNVASTRTNSILAELNDFAMGLNNDQSMAKVLFKDSVSGQQMQQVVQNLDISGQRIKTLTSSLDSLLNGMTSKGGAINYLSSDTTVAGKLDSILVNIEEGTARFNENMEALKHNFLTRGYFRKQEKQRKKEEKNRQIQQQ